MIEQAKQIVDFHLNNGRDKKFHLSVGHATNWRCLRFLTEGFGISLSG
jgi:hypothetical protein